MAAVEVFTHPLHGGGRARSAAEAAVAPTSLLAACGRLVCVGQGSHVDVYDAHDVSETGAVLGAGTCKMRFLCAFPVADIADAVTVGALCFLRGGLLAVAGTCARGSVVQAFRLSFSSSLSAHALSLGGSEGGGGGVGAGDGSGSSGVGGGGSGSSYRGSPALAAASSIDQQALPQLVFRAAFGFGAAAATPQLVAHPTLDHTLGIIRAGDGAMRFYDCVPAVDGAVPAAADRESGAVEHPDDSADFVRAALSRDGSVLAVASSARELLVFALSEETVVAGSGPRVAVRGALARAFRCYSAVSALAVLHVPCHPDAFSYSRFRLNGYALVSGHANGFLNLWWCGNAPPEGAGDGGSDGDAEGGSRARAGDPSGRGLGPRLGRDDDVCEGQDLSGGASRRPGAGRAAASHPPPPLPAARPPVSSPAALPPTSQLRFSPAAPMASYPPLHASRGAVLHLSPPLVCAAGGTEDSAHVPPMFASMRAGAGVAAARADGGRAGGGGLATVVCVGAHGARGWRLLELAHLPLPLALPPPPAASAGVGHAGGGLARPDRLRAEWSWDSATGRRALVPPPATDVRHLLQPLFEAPTLADLMRSPVLGDAGAGGWRSTDPSRIAPASSTPAGQGQGQGQAIDPHGCALLQRYPSADSALLPAAALESGTADDSAPADRLFPGLAPAAVAACHSLFRLLARSPGGRFANHAALFPAVDAAGAAAAAAMRLQAGAPAPVPAPRLAAAFLHLPRSVLLLLTERGLHCCGLDHAPGLAADGLAHELGALRAGARREVVRREEALQLLAAELGDIAAAGELAQLQRERAEARAQGLERAQAQAALRLRQQQEAAEEAEAACVRAQLEARARSRVVFAAAPRPPAPRLASASASAIERRPEAPPRPPSQPLHVSRDIWAPLVAAAAATAAAEAGEDAPQPLPRSRVSPPPQLPRPQPHTRPAFPMAITGRFDSVVRGMREVFDTGRDADTSPLSPAAAATRDRYLLPNTARRLALKQRLALVR